MIIGIPKEIKNNENRVGATPAGVKELIKNGHTVYVQKSAGVGSGFSDEEYQKAGATIFTHHRGSLCSIRDDLQGKRTHCCRI
ncbi:hypothetical protein CCAN11_2200012 [Capnocytophaga canimorsus]|uniref:Alanine dehydrogenase/pyridine nucleotide transhydrogenase N-terminal domain-containing protein n=1 Tax=Capnocytophaga canimorsus TaxID=28188 RepID=A0A0B7IFV8_9FLAO|nr:hypothetical protein CCAN11_2200012 [Capnocytophaga canimorsus]